MGEGTGERAEIDIATMAVSGKTERRTGAQRVVFPYNGSARGRNGVKVYNWNDALLSPDNVTLVLFGS